MTTPYRAFCNIFKQLAPLGLSLAVVAVSLTGCQNNPGNGESAQLRKAKQLIEQGNFEEAFVELNQALDQAPRDPNLHINLGWLYLYTNDLDNATKELTQAETLGPNLAETYHLRGAILSYQAQHTSEPRQSRQLQEEAVQNFKQALQRDEKNHQTYFDLATSLSVLNRQEEALAALDKGFQYIPDKDLETQVNFQIATCAAEAQLQQYDEAIKDCHQALEFTTNPASRERITDMIENMKLMNPGLSQKIDAQQAEKDRQAEENAIIDTAASD
jgi:tetratricopeptide (TPR) repeat protein